MNIIEKIKRHGISGSGRIAATLLKRAYFRYYCRNAPVYVNPTPDQLVDIEQDLRELGVCIDNFSPSPEAFQKFKVEAWFPLDYHGGQHSGVWDEKLLEHWLSSEILGLKNYGKDDIFIDVAACGSPWAKVLRERMGLTAFAIDLDNSSEAYSDLSYYRIENATKTKFSNESVSGCALHCAFEMFMGKDDIGLIAEAARILKPGGKMVILPIYMHTHYCSYVSPECYGKGYSDPLAKEYVEPNMTGIVSSRKYDAEQLKKRVLDPIIRLGMRYRLLILRNKVELSQFIYCHFILEIER
jgi:SAM-dependent methyltransferase